MHGSPCFVKGTKILTKQGYKNIEDVVIGDEVLTHKNRFKKVLKIGGNKKQQVFSLKAQGIIETIVTGNHPYYTREMYKKWDNSSRKYTREFKEPQWKQVKDLTKSDFIGINIPTIEENPYNLDEETCWFLGRYVADGHLRYTKRKNRTNSYQYGVVYSIGNKKIDDFKKHLTNYKATIFPHTKSCYRAIICNEKLVKFINENNFGKHAIEKDIPMFILNLPVNLAQKFLEGYMSGDGCFTNNIFKATTISENLIYKLQLLVAKVYKTSSCLYYVKRPPITIIENREVKQHDSYNVTFNTKLKKQNKTFVDLENNIIWYPIKSITMLKELQDVYNLEVEEDNSYTANNNIVHNCQDFSLAGKQAGGDEGSGTRSSLMYETIRIVKDIKPKYVVWENVKNLLSVKHKHNFDAYIETMEQLGYANYYQVLNSKNYEIPQNRERVFTISIRNDIEKTFEFPQKQELKLKLKDLLEEEVDEKYYLSQKAIQGRLTTSYQKYKLEENIINNKDVHPTILARYEGAPTLYKQGHQEATEGTRCDCSGVAVIGTYDYAQSDTLRPTEESRTHIGKEISGTLLQSGNHNGIIESETKIIGAAQRGRYDENGNIKQQIETNKQEVSNTITTVQKDSLISNNLRIRKLTPKECWRLMGFSDEAFDKSSKVNSNSALYKQAGNSIVVNVLEAIFKNLFTL